MQAVVASGHEKVSEAACEIMKIGGNAFDAVVAAGFASVVAEPLLTSLGGGGFLLSRLHSGNSILYDFFVDTPGLDNPVATADPHFIPITVHFPGSDQIFNVGYGSVAVPGVLRGLLHVHKKLGHLPLKEVLAPAMHYARHGIHFNRTQAYILHLLQPIMKLSSLGRQLFLPHGDMLREGDNFSNTDFANFLETLHRDGDREFYDGEIAGRIAQDMNRHGGILSRRDLAAYRVIERQPLSVNYRHHTLLTNPWPSFGGTMLAFALRWLEKSMTVETRYGSERHLLGLITLMQELYARREAGDLFREGSWGDDFSLNIKNVRKAFGGTTHISVLDREGNAASLTCSNGEGSGYVVPETGIMLNNMMGEDDLHPEGFHKDPPGKRIASMMSPSMILWDEHVRFVLGSGGSKRIWTALLQVISNVLDFKMDLNEAVLAPRLHWDGQYAQIEPGYAEDIITAVNEAFAVNLWQVKDVYFGGVHAVANNGQGAGDNRRDGAVAFS
ncbi:MAG: gamma-glutamyltransferase [Deferribacteres bacterium]|nr:gamma-glutamyltransferase [candidate division KSB1 bacterium]MCB9503651.1 gamma-glutamyltransferase [Deferribacteres bacterium]